MTAHRRALRILVSLLLTTLIVVASAAAAQAQTIKVTTNGDTGTGAGDCLTADTDCSLRQAINSEDGTASGGDTIMLGSGTYTLTQGANLDITKSVTLAGNGVGATTIDGSQNIANNAQSRILRVDGVGLTIQGLTFTGGFDGADEVPCHPCSTISLNGGGALWNNGGAVDISGVAFANNPGGPLGGGISNSGGSLTMTDVSFTNDQASIGGALFSHGGEISGTGVTFENDATGCCNEGAVYLLAGAASFTNTTVVGSGGPSSVGGGIHNGGGFLTLTNDTLSDNVRGSLMTDQGASTTVTNTIVANGFSDGDGDCVQPGVADGATDRTSGNAITNDNGGNLDQDKSCGLTADGDKPGADPKLASIADNGGPTRTEALVFGSPAFGAGKAGNCPEVDQRDQPRAHPCDIGAFEAQFTEHQPSASTAPATNVGQTQADLGANIDFGGEAGGLHFVWGTSSDSLTNVTPESGEGVIDGATPKSQTLQNLKPGTTYFYKAVADNATGSATSRVVQHFTTAAGPPVVSSISLGLVTDTTATIDFSIDPQGADTTYTVEYGPDTSYGQQTQPIDIGSAAGAQNLGATLTNLTPGATYHVNVVATNSIEPDGSSGDTTFTTDRQVQGTAGTALHVDDTRDLGFFCPATATVDWGDGNTDQNVPVDCVFSGDEENPPRYTLTASHTYAAAGHYPIQISYDNGDRSHLFAQITSPQTQPGSGNPPPGTGNQPPGTGNQPPGTGNQPPPSPAAPGVSGGAPTSRASNGASVSGIVNPEGMLTQAHFEYGLDLSQRGPGASTELYDQSTPAQTVGSDRTDHAVSAGLSGLVPGAVYHVRLVANNAAGTTFGQDQAFTTAAAPAPPPPVLAKSQNVKPVSGTVFIKGPNGQFIPLTGATQIPSGSEIDALHGSLQIIAALGHGKTDQGIFGGAIFKLTQSHTGLTTLRLIDAAFTGAPSYATCKAHKAGDATAAALSSKSLQLLHASAHGKFRTTGRYSAATVRGTRWTIADRCDGTLTHDITHSVAVTDFVRHKTIILHAGQSYLAAAHRLHG